MMALMEYTPVFGLPGARLYSVDDVPDPTLGSDGDQATSVNGTTYKKANGAWAPQQSGTSGQTQFVTCGVSSNGGPEPVDCFAICPLVNGTVTPATVTTAKQTVPSGAGNGFAIAFTPVGGSIPGTVYLDWIMVEVSNTDGTEKIGLFHSYTADTQLLNMTSVFNLADLTAFETVGSDLAVSADHLSVDSTAGGQLECEVTFQVAYVAP